jgi:hypothetical protein
MQVVHTTGFIMMIAKQRRLAAACAALSLAASIRPAAALDVYWDGSANSNYADGANWSSGFVPESNPGLGISERGVIGTTNPAGLINGAAVLSSTPVPGGGLSLGLRSRTATGAVDPAIPPPAAGTLIGSLTINSGTMAHQSTDQAALGADGRVLVGVEGRGFLTMNGGTLNALGLVVAGENFTGGDGVSRVALRGNSTVNITGTTGQSGLSTFGRRLSVEGPNVNFTTARTLRFEGTNSYTAVITSATQHSALKTNTNAILGGTINVQFSGAGATHVLGQTWNLVDATTAIGGSFVTLPGGDVPVSGLASPPPAGAVYRLRRVPGPAGHTLEQLIYDRVLVLRVNRDTGELSIRNPLGGTIAIDSYSVTSPLGSLVSSYSGISGQTTPPDAGWVKAAANSATILTELKAPDTTPPIGNQEAFNLTSIPSVTLGTGFSRTAVGASTANLGTDGEDLVFTYGGPQFGTDIIRGVVEYVGTKFENNLVLRVNPTTGQAFLKNDSLVSLSFDGFSILSTEPVLSTGWTGITGGGWEKSVPGSTTALSQTNPVGTQTLAPGAQVAIGDIGAFTTAAAQNGLSMEFILSSGFGASPFDFNADGNVDGTDFLFWQRRAGTATGTAEELAGWRAAFGGGGGGAPEETFRVGSVVFDATAGVAASGAVPEPGAASLLAVGLIAGLWTRRSVPRKAQGTVGTLGGCVMTNKPIAIRMSAFGVCWLATLVASTAVAVTQGIPLANGRGEIPGPVGTKTLAFNPDGSPNTTIQATMGWTFPGPGVEDFGHAGTLGDSGTEGGGNPGNEFLLSTKDGVMFQTSAFNVVSVPATQKYLLTFDAHDIFTIDMSDAGLADSCAITARLYYLQADGVTRTTIGAPLVVAPLPGAFANYSIEIVGGSAALTPAIGRPIGVEFDTTSQEFNPAVGRSWAGVDNILLQIAGTMEGDLDGDGDIDLTDYRVIRDNLQETHDYLAQGELTGDGFVNLNDFRRWKNLPPVIASGVLAQIAVPEPASLALLGIAALAVRRLRPRRATPCATAGSSSSGKRVHGAHCWTSQQWHAAVSAAIVVGAIAAAPSTSRGELLAYDPIALGTNPAAGEYTVGAVVAGQNPTIGPASPSFFRDPWFSASGVGTQVVDAGNLSFLGSPSQGGSINGFGRTSRFLNVGWDDTTSGTFYIGFQMNFGVADAGGNMGYHALETYPIGVNPGENRNGDIGYNQFFSTFGAPQQSAATAKMQFNIGGQQIIDGGPDTYNLDGSNHLIVLKFVLSGAAGDGLDAVTMYLDPTSLTEPTIPNAQRIGTGSGTPGAFDFTLGALGPATFGGGTTTVFDELRVATTFAEAVPDFPLPGDTNNDDLVNIVDYQNIFDHMNLTGAAVPNTLELHPDVTGDGRVTIADFRLWKHNRTDLSAALPGDAVVPEPTGAALALTALAALGRARRGKSGGRA